MFYVKIKVFYSLRVKGISFIILLDIFGVVFFLNLYILIDSLLLFITLKIILLIYSISNPFIFIEMSLSTMRTLNIWLSLIHIKNSLRDTVFLLPLLNIKLEIKGRQC